MTEARTCSFAACVCQNYMNTIVFKAQNNKQEIRQKTHGLLKSNQLLRNKGRWLKNFKRSSYYQMKKIRSFTSKSQKLRRNKKILPFIMKLKCKMTLMQIIVLRHYLNSSNQNRDPGTLKIQKGPIFASK